MSDASVDELHDFVTRQGIPRRAFQGDHYDIPEEYRRQMIDAGAQVVGSRELVRRLRAAGLRVSPAQRRASVGSPQRRLAVVTGASRGIGAAVACALAPAHELVIVGRDEDDLAVTASHVGGARAIAVDLTDHDAVRAALGELDRVDVLVHSAGVVELGAIGDTDSEAWRQAFEVNVTAVAALTRILLPALRAVSGHVVCINSGAGRVANPEWGSYAASKFALRAFADVLRAEETSLRVTTVFPGRTATEMQQAVRAAEGGEYEPDRYLRPESVAAAVAYAVNAPPDAHVTEVVIRPR